MLISRRAARSSRKRKVGAIRSGDPHRPYFAPQVCALYLDVRSVPGQDPLATKAEISQVLSDIGLAHEIDLYHFRPGYEARNIDRLEQAVRRAHSANFGAEPPEPFVETSSMWRDLNVFNEVGISALTYGPRAAIHSYKRALTIDSLYQAARVYARTAVDLCNQEKVK
jgi:acetylornithine deacetylase/succinyl-diaminopimelate desuccinylase-like protein